MAGTARLGGITALQAAGLSGLADTDIHVWVEKSTRKGNRRLVPGVVLHESRRWTAEDAADDQTMPRARPPVAAVQAALWAVSLRQAALFLVMPVQQGIVAVDDIRLVMERVRRHRFRLPLRQVIDDIGTGSHSMNELDFLRLCRVYGLPEPVRQTVRHTASGRRYLDVEWPQLGVKLEIQGAGHGQLLNALADDVRLMDLACEDGAAVSISVLSLRVDPAPVMEALGRLLQSRGWPGRLTA